MSNLPDESDLPPRDHNAPPAVVPAITPDQLRDHMSYKNQELIERARECYAKAKETPDVCSDDETESLITDRIGAIQKSIKAMEGARVSEKEPYMTLERTVDAFFNPIKDSLEKAKKRLSVIGGKYQADKAAAERARLKKIADAEEEKKQAALKEAQENERIAREAREAALSAEEEGQTAIAASLHQSATALEQKADENMGVAVEAEKQQDSAIRASNAKSSTLAVSHGSYGSRGSLRETVKGEITDRNAIDKEMLWPFIKTEHLQTAVNEFVKTQTKSGDREFKIFAGIRIFIIEMMQVRA